jgi:hypothetical protein
MAGADELGRLWACASRSRQRKVSEDSSDPQAALRARLQVLVYKLGRSVIKLTEAVGRQGPVGRMRDWMISHRIISGDGSTKRH